MKRTQIQIPDELYGVAKRISARLEISLAELVRRGLEYVVATTPCCLDDAQEWTLPEPRRLGSRDPFRNEDWRSEIHTSHLRVVEEPGEYGDKGAES